MRLLLAWAMSECRRLYFSAHAVPSRPLLYKAGLRLWTQSFKQRDGPGRLGDDDRIGGERCSRIPVTDQQPSRFPGRRVGAAGAERVERNPGSACLVIKSPRECEFGLQLPPQYWKGPSWCRQYARMDCNRCGFGTCWWRSRVGLPRRIGWRVKFPRWQMDVRGSSHFGYRPHRPPRPRRGP